MTIAGIYIVLLTLYTPFLKPKMLLGNITIALMGGFTFLWGGITGGHIVKAIYPATFAFLMHLSREIVKDVEDLEGDTSVGIKTLAAVVGKERALRLSIFILILLSAPVISSLFFYNIYYTAGMVVLVLLPLFALIIDGLRKLPDPSILQKRLKYLMASGLIGITLGGI